MIKIAQRLKELREEKRLGVMELANKLNIPHPYISRWEAGKHLPTIESLVTLCKFFNCTAGYLIGLED